MRRADEHQHGAPGRPIHTPAICGHLPGMPDLGPQIHMLSMAAGHLPGVPHQGLQIHMLLGTEAGHQPGLRTHVHQIHILTTLVRHPHGVIVHRLHGLGRTGVVTRMG
jgi:hypothetical protein